MIVLAVLGLIIIFQVFNLAQNAFFSFAAAGALLVIVPLPLRIADWTILSVLAPLLAEIYHGLGGRFGNFLGATVVDTFAFCGLAAILLLSFQALQSGKHVPHLMAAAVLPIFAAIAAIVLNRSAGATVSVYDLYLYTFDNSFGGQASAFIARRLDAWPLLLRLCAVCYQALPLMLVLVIALQVKQRRTFPTFPVMVFGLAGLVAPMLYQLLPAVGPEYVFGPQFAYQTHQAFALTPITPVQPAPANSIPSLHFAWALLALWNMPRRNRAAIGAASFFVLVITVATLGLGEHYLIDLVVAVPFAVSVQSTCMARWESALLSGVITLSWLCYLRFALPYYELSIPLTWTAAAITILVPCWTLHRRDVPVSAPSAEEVLVYTEAAV